MELAGVTKLVDVADLKSAGDKKAVRVRFPSPAPLSSKEGRQDLVAFLIFTPAKSDLALDHSLPVIQRLRLA